MLENHRIRRSWVRVRTLRIRFLVDSNQRLKNLYLSLPSLVLGIIRRGQGLYSRSWCRWPVVPLRQHYKSCHDCALSQVGAHSDMTLDVARTQKNNKQTNSFRHPDWLLHTDADSGSFMGRAQVACVTFDIRGHSTSLLQQSVLINAKCINSI